MTKLPADTILIDGKLIDVKGTLRELDKADCQDSLYFFVKHLWNYMDPSPFVHGWVLEAISEHLQAVCDGEIKRLIINVPPRTSKTSLVSIAFPAWTWIQRHESHTSGPGVQFMFASYSQDMSLEVSTKCRRLIESIPYQDMWGDRFQLASDQNTKHKFDNDRGGTRISTSVGAATTGRGANIICVDDANSAQDALSEAVIASTIEWWEGALSTRLNNPKEGAFINIQQRLAESDLTGHILEKSHGNWTHLMIPMRYEPERSFSTLIGWKDPRTEAGELLWPERFGEKEVKALEKEMGSFRSAGQFQQRPEPAGGGVIKREWWQLWEADAYPPMDYVLASLDTAYTLKTENDYSALTVWGVFSGDVVAQGQKTTGGAIKRSYASTSPKVMLMYAWQDRKEIHDLVKQVSQICKAMKVDKLLIENKAAGISVAQEFNRMYGYEDFAVQLHDPKSIDKLARLYSVQHIFAEGMVYAPDKTWAEMTIAQIGTFPKGKHDDLVDTASQALRHLRELGMLQRAPEAQAEIQDSMQHHGRAPPPLYGGV